MTQPASGPKMSTSNQTAAAAHAQPELHTVFRGKNGTLIRIRPISENDAKREQAFVRALSPETRYRRFMSVCSELSDDQLERFTHIDYDRNMAFIALIEENGVDKEIGVCRYAATTDDSSRSSCEFAIVISDAWQNQGLGYHLMQQLIQAARRHGFATMTGEFLAENIPMLNFVTSLGFQLSTHPNDPCLRKGTLTL
jgi:acetyltransferase